MELTSVVYHELSTSMLSESTSVNACICNQGYFMDVDVCKVCPAGKEGDNNGACQSCQANFYSNNGLEGCIACPENSSSPSDSSDIAACTCNHGYEKVSDTCTICPAGTEGDDNGGCKSCQENFYSNYGLQGCLACPDNHTSPVGSTSQDACVPSQ